METNLDKGIVDGRTLRDWWENTPHGAFQKKCSELGIKLEFGAKPEKLKRYEVEMRYEFSGSGYQTVTVEAENEEEAEKIALEKFDDCSVDCGIGDVTDVDVENIDEVV